MNKSGKTVDEVGEFGLIDRIQKILPSVEEANLLIGIGDDTAVIRLDESRVQLVTCDIQVENQHFRLAHISPYQLGRRAMAVNLSDIAAMGGSPTFALVSLGFPKFFPLTDFEALFQGMRDELAEFSALIIGGNLSQTSDQLIIDITLLGEAAATQFLTRSGAQIGDRIFVSGQLGLSAAGYYVLTKYGLAYPNYLKTLVQAHLQPKPRVQTGRLLAQSGMVTSMIDISDGIVSDLNHICEMSQVGAELLKNQLPVGEIPSIESITDKSRLNLALYGAEVYELLFTVKPETPASMLSSIANESKVALTEIGRILPAAEGFRMADSKGNSIPIKPKGWDHFSTN